jgi:hypothetical protein
MLKRLLDAPTSAFIISVGLIIVTAYAVSHFPRSIVAFMLFQASIWCSTSRGCPRG